MLLGPPLGLGAPGSCLSLWTSPWTPFAAGVFPGKCGRLQPTRAERDLWHLDLPGVLGEALCGLGVHLRSVPKGGRSGPHVGRPFHPRASESGGDIGDEASPLLCSFVRSVTMDKWKDVELEKMKAGGNARFREFLESQEDYGPLLVAAGEVQQQGQLPPSGTG